MKVSILITTKNRKSDLIFTLNKINHLLRETSVECVIFDDGSVDGTYEYVKQNFPEIKIQRNTISKGLIFCRNKMLNETTADYAVSLDDDAHFVTENALQFIINYFDKNADCALLALRIFWGREESESLDSFESAHRVKSFVGCGHVWRMSAWKNIPNYPEWFVFYGEEDFASYQLFKKKWEIHYLPNVLVHHRVDIKSRKNDADYVFRLRRSLRSGWYLYFLFYPLSVIPRKMGYSVWTQLRLKVLKGDFKALQALVLATLDLVVAVPKIIKNSNRLTQDEFINYNRLSETKIYWNPKD